MYASVRINSRSAQFNIWLKYKFYILNHYWIYYSYYIFKGLVYFSYNVAAWNGGELCALIIKQWFDLSQFMSIVYINIINFIYQAYYSYFD